MRMIRSIFQLKSLMAIGLAAALVTAVQVAPSEAGHRKRAAIAAGLIIGGVALYHASRHHRKYHRRYHYGHRYHSRRYYRAPRVVYRSHRYRHGHYHRHGHVYYHQHYVPGGHLR